MPRPNPMILNPDEIIYEEDDELENLPSGQRKEFYLYELKKLIKGPSDTLLTFSPNNINLVIIDKDEYLKFEAWRPDEQIYEYRTRQSVTQLDGEVDIAQYEKQNVHSFLDLEGSLQFSNGKTFKYSRNKLYMVSEWILETDEDINNWGYLIQKIDADSPLTDNISGNKDIEIVDLNTWAARDSHNAIFRIGKQLDEFEVTDIEINAPKSFMLDSASIIGKNEHGDYEYTDIEFKEELTPFWLNPIEKKDTGEVNFLNLWMTENIIKNEEVKLFTDENGSSINKFIDTKSSKNDKEEDSEDNWIQVKEDVLAVKFTVKGVEFETNLGKIIKHDEPIVFEYSQDKLFNSPSWQYNFNGDYKTLLNHGFLLEGREENSRVLVHHKFKTVKATDNNLINFKYNIIKKTYASELSKLLVEILNASYNYNNNFKGAGYKNPETGELNEMAIYKQSFEGKTIVEYIDGLEKNWENDNTDKLNSNEYKKYKQIRIMLSNYIYGSKSIANGGNENCKYLLPYYFDLKVKPSWSGNNPETGDGIWQYPSDIRVVIRSEYYNIDKKTGNLFLKNKKISDKSIFNTYYDSYIWPNIGNNIEENALESLKPISFKLADENVGKYLVFGNADLKEKYGADNNYFKINHYQLNTINKNFTNIINLKLNTKNIKLINISGIYGSGKWSLKLKNSNNSIVLNNLNLFKINKQNIGTIKISL